MNSSTQSDNSNNAGRSAELMPQIRTTDDIKRLGTILFIAAHPDDETFLAGGVLAAAVKNGQIVIVITATHGEAGAQNQAKWPRPTLGSVRKHELSRALHELGVTKHHLFDYPDGGCAKVWAHSAVSLLRSLIERYQPDTILTFGPDGLTGHPDHQTVSAWTDAALQGIVKQVHVFHAVQTHENYEANLKQIDKKVNLFFNIDKPPLVPEQACAIAYHLPPGIEEQKKRALAAMPSQTEILFSSVAREFIDRAFSCEYFVEAHDA